MGYGLYFIKDGLGNFSIAENKDCYWIKQGNPLY